MPLRLVALPICPYLPLHTLLSSAAGPLEMWLRAKRKTYILLRSTKEIVEPFDPGLAGLVAIQLHNDVLC